MRAVLLLLALVAPAAALAQPVIAPDAARLGLDEVGLYFVGYRYAGQPERQFPLGWSGFFEERTGVACQPVGVRNGRPAFLLHCPWRGGTGIAFQQFRVALPRARRILLRGSTAMRADIVGQSDGADFRVFLDGRALVDRNQADARWRPFEIDLTRLAGRTVRIRFETGPGPRQNPGFDFSLWAGRELVFEGYRPAPARRPAPPALDLTAIAGRAEDGAAPRGGFAFRTSRSIQADSAVLTYRGADGEMRYTWRVPRKDDAAPLGALELVAHIGGGAAVRVPLASTASMEWADAARPVRARFRQTGDSITLEREYDLGGRHAVLTARARLVGKSLVLDVRCSVPLVSRFDAGGWGPVVRRRQVTVPYYSGQVHYLPREGLFVSAFLDWTASSASSHDGTAATYGALTDGSRSSLRERLVYSAAWHLAEALPRIPNPPSPYRRMLSDRVVLDVWGGRYEDIARRLRALSDYDIRRCVVIIHVWQRSGYDNALPAHVPAMAELGGDAGMRALVREGAALGMLVAPHENYVDYYPNYDRFDPNDIALDSSGDRVPAWYNPGTKVQSFAVKPNAILRLAATQSPEIHRRYGTNADYLDVHSAVPPWFHVDFRAREEGAGTFARVWDVHRRLWTYERKTHGGPVFGEGNNHWYWSGLLDGVEAQFGAGWPSNQGLAAPLMVDFDLLRIHPLQLNHGMGYYERWWDRADWGTLPPMVVLDQYRAQEVAFGHAGFLGAATWSVLPLAWLEHHLLTPVTARTGTAAVRRICYQVGGRWVDPTAAAIAGTWDRVQVEYAGGVRVTVNGAPTPLVADGRTLPQFGWLATGPGLAAWTALRHGVVCDYAETPNRVFANARNAAHWNLSGLVAVRPGVASFEQSGPRRFRVTYRWRVGAPPTSDYRAFVHFGNPGREPWDEGIRFQQDHVLPRPTNRWKAGETVADGPYEVRVPDDVPDGTYAWTTGLFAAGGGPRAPLEGPTDRHGRVVLGRLVVAEGGLSLRFEPERSTGADLQALFAEHLNARGAAIDFGPVRTDGSVLARREGADWVLQTLPRDARFVVELDARRFGRPRAVRTDAGMVRPTSADRRWRLPLNGSRAYRWPAR
ncbi:MAG: hypothetical protein IT208_02145 [Chthonomonadales bacterium]|nr:hypothetical protein [Chthonomonadales bacterium]